MTRRRGTQDGYVLIEALATLAISAFLIAALGSVVALVLGVADRSALAVQTLETTDRAMAAVARDVAAAVRARTAGGAGRPAGFAFEGGADRLILVIDRVDETGLARPVAVRWTSRVSAAGRGVLERAEAMLPPVLASMDAIGFGAPHRLDTGPMVVTFAYYGPQPSGPGDLLTDVWLTPNLLPTGIRLGRTDPSDGSLIGSVRLPFPIRGEPGCAQPDKGYCSLARGGARPAEGASPGADGAPTDGGNAGDGG